MNRLDRKIMAATVATVLNDLDNIKSGSKRDRRTPSDLVTAITLICSDLRKKDGALEASIADLEDHMWMVSTAYEKLLTIGEATHLVEKAGR